MEKAVEKARSEAAAKAKEGGGVTDSSREEGGGGKEGGGGGGGGEGASMKAEVEAQTAAGRTARKEVGKVEEELCTRSSKLQAALCEAESRVEGANARTKELETEVAALKEQSLASSTPASPAADKRLREERRRDKPAKKRDAEVERLQKAHHQITR